MKRPLITFAVVLVSALAFFSVIAVQQNNTEGAIAKSPGFVLAEPQGITKKTKKSRETFQVNYTYAVDGVSYKMDTGWMETVAEAEAMAASPVQIAYAKSSPGEAIFKNDFDKRDPDAGIGSTLFRVVWTGLLASVLITLGLLWQVPWLRRG